MQGTSIIEDHSKRKDYFSCNAHFKVFTFTWFRLAGTVHLAHYILLLISFVYDTHFWLLLKQFWLSLYLILYVVYTTGLATCVKICWRLDNVFHIVAHTPQCCPPTPYHVKECLERHQTYHKGEIELKPLKMQTTKSVRSNMSYMRYKAIRRVWSII